MFSAISALRSARRAWLIGTKSVGKDGRHQKDKHPKTSTGRINRQGENPVAWTTTNSLSDISRLVARRSTRQRLRSVGQRG